MVLPTEEVWAAVVDLGAMAESSPELQSVEWIDGGGPALGSRFVGRSRHDALGERETTSHVVGVRAAAGIRVDGRRPATWRFTLRPEEGGIRLTEWMRPGPGRSGLSRAIDRMPDKEQKIVFVRIREFETNLTGTVAAGQRRTWTASPGCNPA